MRGTVEYRQWKQRRIDIELAIARLRGETVDVATPDGVFRHYPDGRVVKQTNKRGSGKRWVDETQDWEDL